MREHYTRTARHWIDTLESRFDEFVALQGEEVARVWRLYLAGGALAFEEGRMGVDQVLVVR
jgi:cyclopropane-fatty-acyl-phospholipid synthase